MWALYGEKQRWKNSECLLLKTKSKGQADIVISMMLFCIVLLAILFGFRIAQYMVTAAGIEDALAASNLAAAVIDLEEYGKSHVISIPDAGAAFGLYREALCCNLSLDENLYASGNGVLSSRLEIQQFILYNVRGELVESLVLDGKGCLQARETGRRGEVFTPDNVCVENTTVYSRVGFWVEVLQGQQLYAEKEKSIDIMRCNSE